MAKSTITAAGAAAKQDAPVFPVPDPVPPVVAAGRPAAPLPQIGTRTPDAGPLPTPAAAEAAAEVVGRRLSPPLAAPRAMPLDPVAPYGHTTTAAPVTVADPLFRREGTIDLLTRHPNSSVRQRALEAQVAIHHGAPDIGIKVKAALDTAREAERNR